MNVLNEIPKVEQIIGMALIGTVVSMTNISETLRVLILILTVVGICIRLYGQFKESPLKSDLIKWIHKGKKD